MAHDKYDNDILKALKSIDNSLKIIAKGGQMTTPTDGAEKSTNIIRLGDFISLFSTDDTMELNIKLGDAIYEKIRTDSPALIPYYTYKIIFIEMWEYFATNRLLIEIEKIEEN